MEPAPYAALKTGRRQEHQEYELVQAENPELNKAT